MKRYEYYVEHPKCLDCPTGREYFQNIKEANVFAQRLANELRKPVARHGVNGGKALFYPAY